MAAISEQHLKVLKKWALESDKKVMANNLSWDNSAKIKLAIKKGISYPWIPSFFIQSLVKSLEKVMSFVRGDFRGEVGIVYDFFSNMVDQ